MTGYLLEAAGDGPGFAWADRRELEELAVAAVDVVRPLGNQLPENLPQPRRAHRLPEPLPADPPILAEHAPQHAA